MAHNIHLPCDGDGVCMRCKAMSPFEENLTCSTCVTPLHLACLSSKPETLASALQWECPDCSDDVTAAAPADVFGDGNELLAAIREIESDKTLTDREKAKKRQELMSEKVEVGDEKKGKGKDSETDVLDVLDESFKCYFCMQLPDRPVTPETIKKTLVNQMLLCFGIIFASQENSGMLQLLGMIEQRLKAGKRQAWHVASLTNICVGLLAGLKVLAYLFYLLKMPA